MSIQGGERFLFALKTESIKGRMKIKGGFIMPRKRNEQYEKYEQRKLYFYFSQLSAIYGDIGEFFSEKYKYEKDG